MQGFFSLFQVFGNPFAQRTSWVELERLFDREDPAVMRTYGNCLVPARDSDHRKAA